MIALALMSPHPVGYWDQVRPALEDLAVVREFAFHTDASIDAFAQRVLTAMPSRFAAVGACLGGYAVFEMLRTNAARLQGVALIGTSASADPQWRRAERERRIQHWEDKVARGLGLSSESAGQILSWMIGRESLTDTDVVARARDVVMSAGAAGMLAQQRAIAQRDTSRWPLECRDERALVIVGAEDRMCSRADADLLARALTRQPAHVVPNCGHLLAVERPRQLIELLRGWLMSLS